MSNNDYWHRCFQNWQLIYKPDYKFSESCGEISDVTVYPKKLTSEEIAALYRALKEKP